MSGFCVEHGPFPGDVAPCPGCEQELLHRLREDQSKQANKSILDTANEVIYGDREKTYGDPGKNLRVIAEFWETYLQARGLWGADRNQLTAEDVCHMMNLLKTARLANTPGHLDSLVDICGYTALVERINEKDSVPQK